MTGVEILAAKEVVVSSTFNWTVCLIAFFLTFAIAVGVAILMFVYSFDACDIAVCVFAGVLGGCFVGGLFGSSICVEKQYETQYKVIISDEVSMNEFLSKYEIISQEGRIYTVRSLEEVHD